MKKIFLILLVLVIISASAIAQVAINGDASQPDPSAMLDLKSTTKGFLVPRMTTVERDAITNPATGLIIYNIDNDQLYCNKGTPGFPIWMMLSSQWVTIGSNIFYNAGSVGIGTFVPSYKLDVNGSISSRAPNVPFIWTGNSLGSDVLSIWGQNLPEVSLVKHPSAQGFAMPESDRFSVYKRTGAGDPATDQEIFTVKATGEVGIGTGTPHPSAQAEIASIQKGFLPPRMTINQRNSIANPAIGLTVYNTDLNCLEFYTGPVNGWYCPCQSTGILECNTLQVQGTYVAGFPLESSHSVAVTVTPVTMGNFAIGTNYVNGMGFKALGIFTATATTVINLYGYGTPSTPGTFEYILNYGVSYCTFTVTVYSMGQPCPGLPSFTDSRDGKTYNTVLVGTQCWMKENLNIGSRIDGQVEQSDNGIFEKYCYNDLESNCQVYGGLYQWGEMVQYLNGASNTTSWNPAPAGAVTGLCPSGWHLPSNDEWLTILNFLGGQDIAGGKLKETGVLHWNTPNTGATNESGFSAFASGNRSIPGGFFNLLNSASVWSSNENTATTAPFRMLNYNSPGATLHETVKATGLSIRCIKN